MCTGEHAPPGSCVAVFITNLKEDCISLFICLHARLYKIATVNIR